MDFLIAFRSADNTDVTHSWLWIVEQGAPHLDVKKVKFENVAVSDDHQPWALDASHLHEQHHQQGQHQHHQDHKPTYTAGLLAGTRRELHQLCNM